MRTLHFIYPVKEISMCCIHLGYKHTRYFFLVTSLFPVRGTWLGKSVSAAQLTIAVCT
ncbi:hypothetical protein C8R41DRAFT_860445 [Lentinula lateritia]|uniref:Uncharacterized protein n=1 Tax=Lentinula lateritia TaxID=40482 RepID=A0ABQ8UWU3_9AGAR|nr:hypothetical protein C8R41DRAFT_860445 [Lentinula lateritia]